MRKTIIALSGTANIGKSMTLSRLGRQLATSGANTDDDISGQDYCAVFRFRDVMVGIQTFGDRQDLVSDGLNHFLANACEVIAIASKGYGETVNLLESFAASNGYRLIWAAPYEVRDNTITTEAIKDYGAGHLRFMINDIITGNL